ncbi:phosphate binding protein [Fusobacterium necrophorum subsp. funduliforme ATCC 51357]|uniref:Phosphate-binding protein n=2 Tax=Fusobacterium necrophorum TaxID=859 RepID=A0A161PQY5_9FUSO|nr:phosphate ABC transporter substrate-binding protein [Fusobacterium necrophorum]AYV92392.1 phosphate ABC transporter substrate-binding protein [Fusobacterium necrophorum subsp. funduliforme]EIJ71035.1 phosphate binding protein [Fusobacterium necrophorum subsp. funduliforme ATCC 51357]KAB0553443.1 phosphate ABC transporter substrate-binding protein [Fusobacterium necrophorum subsp. funduliforme]KYL03638.1 phosphate ABC transporter substrate-binding protein [Fusobacterium necrophorum subsp. fun
MKLLEKKKILCLFSLVIALGSSLYAKSNVLQLKGSDTLLHVSQAITEQYQKETKTRIAISGGGSGIGISALLNGTTDIAMASRSIKAKEQELAKAKGMKIKETVLGFDGITVIVNKGNHIKNMNTRLLAKVFRGEIKNWKELGGEDAPIVVLSRDSSSGTHEFFKEHIIRERNSKGRQEYGKKTLYLPSNEAIKQEVAKNKNAIGYIGMGYVDSSVHSLEIDGKTASAENILNKSYPISREIYWYSNQNLSENGKSLIQYALSPKGQQIIKQEGFVPIK